MHLQHLEGASAIDEAWRLADVHLLSNLAVQERRLHAHGLHLLLELTYDSEQEAHEVQARNWCKDVIEIDPRSLDVPLCNQTRIVLHHIVIGIMLELVHPFEDDWLVTCRKISEGPCAILLDRHELIQHRLAPMFIILCFRERCGLIRRGEKEPLRLSGVVGVEIQLVQ